MSFKSILTVVTDHDLLTSTLSHAAMVAKAHDAHLGALCFGVDRTQTGYYYAGANAMVLQETLERATAEAEALATVARRELEKVDSLWSVDHGVAQLADIGRHVASRARFTDLVVLSNDCDDGTDAMLDRLAEVAAAQPDTRIVNGLSLPETMGLALSSDPRDPTGTITTTKGRPVGGVEVMIVDPRTGMDVLLYQTGEVWLRGTGVFLGYAGKPGAGFTDRFFRTGILGHLDSEGRLVLPKAEEEVLLSGW